MAAIIRPGRIGEMSVIGFALLMASIVYGGYVAADPVLGPMFTFSGVELSWMLIAYGFIASVLPVWVLLAPRDYLSTFLKIGTILGLAIGIIFVSPDLKMPAVTKFIDGTGPVFAGIAVPVPVHHHCLRRDLGLPLARLVGHHAKDARQRDERPLHRLRRDADGELRCDHGVDRRLLAGAGRLLRDEQPGGIDRHDA